MPKKRMTYAISQEAIDALREMAHKRTIEGGVRVAAGTILEELILSATDVLNPNQSKGRREWGTSSRKEGRAIVKKVGENLFDTTELDDLLG